MTLDELVTKVPKKLMIVVAIEWQKRGGYRRSFGSWAY